MDVKLKNIDKNYFKNKFNYIQICCLPTESQNTFSGNAFPGSGPRSPAPNLPPGTSMEELLKGVPPNVAIKTMGEQQTGEYKEEENKSQEKLDVLLMVSGGWVVAGKD